MRFIALFLFLITVSSCNQKRITHSSSIKEVKTEMSAMDYDTLVIEAPFEMPNILKPLFPNRTFSIVDFGAKQSKDFLNTEPIKKAIEACNLAGGGKVIIPEGRWFTGKIHLKSNVNLHLEQGAILLFSDNPDDYLPAVHSSWEGMECMNYSPLIYAYNCENVAISGKGLIKPVMDLWEVWFARPEKHMEGLAKLYHMAAKNVPVNDRIMVDNDYNLRPQFIQFNRCRNFLIEDIEIYQSPFWVIHLYMSKGGIVRNVNVKALGHNNDGVDPEMTQNLLIEDCVFHQGDDAIAVKSGRNQDAWRLNTPSRNIVIRNCKIIDGHALLAIGSELSGGVQNVFVDNCSFEPIKTSTLSLDFLTHIKTNERRGGFVENIFVENISAPIVKHSILGIETDVLYQWRDLVPTYEVKLTKIKNIHFKNIHVTKAPSIAIINGDEASKIKNVTMDNVEVDKITSKPWVIENSERVKQNNVIHGY